MNDGMRVPASREAPASLERRDGPPRRRPTRSAAALKTFRKYWMK